MNVMVVEDEEMLLQAIARKLESVGYKMIACKTAAEALTKLKAGQSLPDLIWLDYYLTDMNGLEFMQKLKEEPNVSRIPVVVVSNSASPKKVNAMLALGVKRYYLKAQYKLEDIIKELPKVLEEGK